MDGSMAHEARMPPRQQPSHLFRGIASGIRSTITGSGLQECGTSYLKDEQFPRWIAKAPDIDQITSSLAHVHPNFQPGFSTWRYW